MSSRPAITELPRALVDAMNAEEAAEQEVENAAKAAPDSIILEERYPCLPDQPSVNCRVRIHL